MAGMYLSNISSVDICRLVGGSDLAVAKAIFSAGGRGDFFFLGSALWPR